jgi:hypothetical protein
VPSDKPSTRRARLLSLAANPIPDWMKGVPTLAELAAGCALRLEDEIANEHDPVMRAQLLAEAAASERALEAEAEGEVDEED